MENMCAPFGGKKITVMGLGLLGRGVGDVEFLAKCGAQIIVTDKKDRFELAESIERLSHFPNVTFHISGHNIVDFTHCDMVIKAAGVRLDSPEIAAARTSEIPVYMSTALFAKYAAEAGVIVVGVTGTRGKSTVTHMIHHVLTKKGKRAVLGGNVRGVSTLAMLPQMQKGDIAVLELDSWQLQGFGDLKISPHIAVFSNLMPDHQNYYKNMEDYFNDKANIFRYQRSGDILVIGPTIAQHVSAAHPPVEPTVPGALAPDWDLKVPGAHNRENASLAATALLHLGLNTQEIKEGLGSYEGVEGRLQLVDEADEVRIFNDNNATTPEATMAALRALDRDIILIAGGADKELDITELVEEMRDRCKKIFLLEGTGTERLHKVFPKVPVYGNLKDAFAAARASAKAGDTILFSPAFASFGMFKNEYDRNDQFMALVGKV
jgi:UDP-N-acetylmuramoylalanine--D-glutamate ligase